MWRFNLSIIVFSTVIFSTCKNETPDSYRTPLLELNQQYLYVEDLPQNASLKLSPKDSAILIDNYIKSWVVDALMYEYAQKNIKNQEEIDRLVEDYRKTLTIQHYQQMLIDQRLGTPSDKEVNAFYDKYSSQFLLDENIIKGVYMKIPQKAPHMGDVRKWMKHIDVENLEKMEKYSVQNYASLDYFQDRWLYLKDVLKNIPLSNVNPETLLSSNNFVEVEDSLYVYMLTISEYKTVNSEEPLDFAREKIRSILLNQQKITFIHQFEEDLYESSKKHIHYFGKKEDVESTH